MKYKAVYKVIPYRNLLIISTVSIEKPNLSTSNSRYDSNVIFGNYTKHSISTGGHIVFGVDGSKKPYIYPFSSSESMRKHLDIIKKSLPLFNEDKHSKYTITLLDVNGNPLFGGD